MKPVEPIFVFLIGFICLAIGLSIGVLVPSNKIETPRNYHVEYIQCDSETWQTIECTNSYQPYLKEGYEMIVDGCARTTNTCGLKYKITNI